MSTGPHAQWEYHPNPALVACPCHPAWAAEQLAQQLIKTILVKVSCTKLKNLNLRDGFTKWIEPTWKLNITSHPSLLLVWLCAPAAYHPLPQKTSCYPIARKKGFFSHHLTNWGGSQMAPTSARVGRGKGMHHTGWRREERGPRPSSFSKSDPLLAQLMISFGWHVLRCNHTISSQILRAGTKTPRAATSRASTAAAGRGQAIRTLLRVWCSADCSQTTLTACCLWNGKSHPPFSPLPHTPPCWQKHLCDFSDRGLDWELVFCFPGFDFNQTDFQTWLTTGTLLPAQGRKGLWWSKLTYAKMSSEVFFCKISFLQIYFFQLIHHKLDER